MGIQYPEIMKMMTLDALFLLEAKVIQQKQYEFDHKNQKTSQKVGGGYYLSDFVPADFDISKWNM